MNSPETASETAACEEISTPRLILTLRDPEEVLAWVASLAPEVKQEISPEWLARLEASDGPDPWTCGFILIEQASRVAVGSCAYKGPPDAEGIVEIAYSVDPSYQGRGYATEAAHALVSYAFATRKVKRVRAHTYAESIASNRVLTKCGFEKLGEVVDPEDGLVWRWEISQSG